MRRFNRTDEQARPLNFIPDFTGNADGSVLVSFGNTKVICTAILEERVPSFLKGKGSGWVTAEYGMLPGSTQQRMSREAARGKQGGRTVEIQRLIGRSLRTCVDYTRLGERMVTVDCDVIQADGGTRTASITGGCVALAMCLWRHRDLFEEVPLVGTVAALSIGLLGPRVCVDLDYEEDSQADVDFNLVMTQDERFVEVQGTAEAEPFSMNHLMAILEAGRNALREVHRRQHSTLLAWGVTEKWLA